MQQMTTSTVPLCACEHLLRTQTERETLQCLECRIQAALKQASLIESKPVKTSVSAK